ncbi:sigma-54-dependent Fis family transcriptional regulator [candidate division KSB1 bacterium]|nr:sigma-54-dependent Fis family transcriptional regulator [candidate division KSB1 bacterium]
MTANRLRADLYYRLAVFVIHVPPLRERRQDIPVFLDHFMQRINSERGYALPQLSNHARSALQNYAWPGNIRQLRHFVERLVILSNKAMVDESDLAGLLDLSATDKNTDRLTRLHDARLEFERRHLLRMIERAHGNMAQGAELLGLNRSNFYRTTRPIKQSGARPRRPLFLRPRRLAQAPQDPALRPRKCTIFPAHKSISIRNTCHQPSARQSRRRSEESKSANCES